MKWAGIALLFLGAYFAVEKYKAWLRARLELLVGYTDFLREMRSRAANYLEPVSSWVGRFRSRALEDAGFLPALRAGKRLCDAFANACDGLDGKVKAALGELFSRTGECLSDEVRRIDRALGVLEGGVEAATRECEDRARVFSALALAVSVGITILAI